MKISKRKLIKILREEIEHHETASEECVEIWMRHEEDTDSMPLKEFSDELGQCMKRSNALLVLQAVKEAQLENPEFKKITFSFSSCTCPETSATQHTAQ
tara:strand:- start:3848 stop:4144 length:297 start_codon:yes stop_codon:yes gene_type:complete